MAGGACTFLDLTACNCFLRWMFRFLHPRASVLDAAAERCCDAAELDAEAGRRAGQLAALDVGPGARVAILQANSLGLVCDLLGVWSLGGIAACLDPSLTEAELETVLDFLQPTAVATSRGYRRGDNPVHHAKSSHKKWQVDDPALILFTSGTTANPRGVVLSYRAILARLSLNRFAIGGDTLRRTLVTLPGHFGHGLIGNILTPLAAGGRVVFDGSGLALAGSIGGIIDRHAISFLSSVPALWQMALKLSSKPEGETLRRVHVGSAPLAGALWARIVDWAGCEVVNCYGMTETANWFAGASSSGGCSDNAVGRAWGGRAGIVAADGRIVPVGEGEIAVLTPSIMSGYLDRPELTDEVLSGGWYFTGDLGRIDESGSIVLTGRVKEEINRAGFKVQPAEIDQLVESHPDVAEACTFAIPDHAGGEMVGVAIRLAPDRLIGEGELRSWCAGRVRHELIPERWFFVAEIPRTRRGKLNRAEVRRTIMGSA